MLPTDDRSKPLSLRDFVAIDPSAEVDATSSLTPGADTSDQVPGGKVGAAGKIVLNAAGLVISADVPGTQDRNARFRAAHRDRLALKSRVRYQNSVAHQEVLARREARRELKLRRLDDRRVQREIERAERKVAARERERARDRIRCQDPRHLARKRELAASYHAIHGHEIYMRNREKHIARSKLWIKNNCERFNKRVSERRQLHPEEARRREKGPIGICRKLLRRVLKKAGLVKTSRTRSMLGYSPEELKLCIEAQFRDGMAWSNQGTVWELDHIREVATYIAEGVTDPAVINALSNLQPLLIDEHRVKTVAFNSLTRVA